MVHISISWYTTRPLPFPLATYTSDVPLRGICISCANRPSSTLFLEFGLVVLCRLPRLLLSLTKFIAPFGKLVKIICSIRKAASHIVKSLGEACAGRAGIDVEGRRGRRSENGLAGGGNVVANKENDDERRGFGGS